MTSKSYKRHAIETLQLAYPIMIGQFGYTLMGLVDSMMVGRVGAEELAASSVGLSVFFIILVFGLGVSFAISPLTAIAEGSNNKSESSSIFSNGLYINVVVGIFLGLLTYFTADVIRYLNQPPRVTELAIEYTKILAISIIPIMFFQSYKQFVDGLSETRPAMIVVILANIVNAIVNWLLIFGNWGFPELGLNGAGYATFFSRIFMAFGFYLFVTRSSRFKEYTLKIFPVVIDKIISKKILKVGIPAGFQHLFEVGAFSFASIMVGWLGTYPLAAHHIALNIAGVTYMIVWGIAASGSIRVGNELGANNIPGIRKAGFVAIVLSFLIMLLFGIIMIFTKNIIPYFYIDEIHVVEIASGLLMIAAFFQIFDGTQATAIGILRGLTDLKVPTLITFVAYWIIALPGAYLLGFIFEWGVEGVWIALLLSLVFSAIALTLRFQIKSKRPVSI